MPADVFKVTRFRSKEAAAKKFQCGVEVLDVIAGAAHSVYQECAYDLPGPEMKRDEIIEVCLDANRAEDVLRRDLSSITRSKSDSPQTVERMARTLRALTVLEEKHAYGDLVGAMRLYFTSRTYETGNNDAEVY